MPEMTLQQAFELARRHQQAGQAQQAGMLYEQVLAHQPDHLPTLENLAQLRFAAGEFAGAADLLRRGIKLRPNSPDLLNNLGMVLATAGQLDEAIESFRRAMALRPGAETCNNLGNALQAGGRPDEAIGAYQQALVQRPDYPDAHNNLAIVLKQQGRSEEALAHFQRCLALLPQYAEAHYNLGLMLKAQDQHDEAVAEFRQAISMRPNYSEALLELGSSLNDREQYDEALALYRQALLARPNYPEAYYGMGNALKDKAEAQQAIEAYGQALALRPDYAEVYNNLGNAFKDLGQMEQATAAYQRAIELRPDMHQPVNNLGFALYDTGRIDEAIAQYQKALALQPDYAEALNNLGTALKDKGQLDQAIEAYRRPVDLGTDLAEPYNNLANALRDIGHLDEAIENYRRAIKARGGADAHSNLLFALWGHPDYTPRQIWDEHLIWRRNFAQPLAPTVPPHAHRGSPNRRLRVGYVSPDLGEHPVGRFLLPLLANHDHQQFEIFCYSDARRADGNTGRLRACADVWRDTFALTAERLADQIRADKIDVLVDLSVHTAHNRLLVFARKPAAVQVTYLGYCGTTGLETMDWRLSDPYFDPAGADQPFASERTFRLPSTYWCYQPLAYAPPVAPLPASAAGHVTFGCLNNAWKLNQRTLETWWQLLRSVAGSHLIAHAHEGTQRRELAAQARSEGIDPERLHLLSRLPANQYFDQYQQIDIALDPFPYPGGTTTCDALWMGVPVVTLSGQTPVSRAGVSILSNVGLPELIANSPQEYVRIAAELAARPDRLAGLRSTLRRRMSTSALMDAPKLARDVEAAFREMWNSRTAQPSDHSGEP